MMPAPHGGKLVHRVLSDSDRARREAELASLPQLRPFIDQVYDAEKIAIGAYSPLEGFMDSATVDSVAGHDRLPGGLPWTIPIVFAPGDAENQKVLAPLKSGDQCALLDDQGRLFAMFHLSEKFAFDKSHVAQSAFGTTDPNHPNVADMMQCGPTAYAGRVDLVRRLDVPAGPLELTPAETREEFHRRKWTHVAAYQCRNPPHTAHEYLQRLTLERSDVDGLLVHPVVGRLKKGDYRPDIILAAYRQLLEHYYPPSRVFLSSLSITMRYAGPKAAVFFAIVRKNYGCSHYIVGRDQAGVGKYYDPYACHRIFDTIDVGAIPLRYEETFFCRKCGWMASVKVCPHPESDRVATSQTRIRAALAAREPLPTEIIRPEVAAVLGGTDNVLN